MNLTIHNSGLRGEVTIPASKSHTIRAVTIAALASGQSVLDNPLESADARAARNAYSMLGADVLVEPARWRIQGTGGLLKTPENVIDVGNSGTTMLIALGSVTLLRSGMAVLTGDAQVRRRPCGPLAEALTTLGAQATSTRNNGCPPFVVSGRFRGGEVEIEAVTSQYVSSLLLNAPLAEGNTRLLVPLLNEKPYVEMTLGWLKRQGVEVSHNEALSEFHIPGGQRYLPASGAVPADWSSATFFLAAGALPGNDVCCIGLDVNDSQGDKAVMDYLRQLGARVVCDDRGVRVSADALRGCELDLNATPDALPMLAALACFASGTTRLVNVPQARLKETDRIAVMHRELSKLGATVTELEDGLVVEESPLRPAKVDGHGDHRVIMALAIAATGIQGETIISGAEAVEVTYPSFSEELEQLGGRVKLDDEHSG